MATVRGGPSLSAMAAILLYHLFRALPLPWAQRFGAALGRLALCLVPRMKRIGRRNLDLAYGAELTRARKRRILREAAANLGIVAAEFPHLPALRARGFAGFLDYEGVDRVDWTRPAMFAGAHLGNWELLAAAVSALGHRVAAVVRPLEDPRLNAVIDSARRAGGIETVPKHHAGDAIVRLLSEGCYCGVLADQAPRFNASLATFFDHPCWATIAPAMLARRAGVPLHPIAAVRNAGGGYTIRIQPAMALADTGNVREDTRENTQRMQDAIEAMIRDHPGQWLWFHDRWKRRERLDREWAERQAARS